MLIVIVDIDCARFASEIDGLINRMRDYPSVTYLVSFSVWNSKDHAAEFREFNWTRYVRAAYFAITRA